MRNLQPPYQAPRRSNAAPVTIPIVSHVTLVAPMKPKDMKVLQNIMPQLVNMSFQYSYTSGFNKLDMKNYMKLDQDS